MFHVCLFGHFTRDVAGQGGLSEGFMDPFFSFRAFSSEVGTGSREENAIKQEDRAVDLIRSDRNRNKSSAIRELKNQNWKWLPGIFLSNQKKTEQNVTSKKNLAGMIT